MNSGSSKVKTIIEIILFIIIVIAVIITKSIPELKKQIGSSDLTFNVGEYTSLVEIDVEEGLDVILVLNEEEINSLLFMNEDSLVLYNKNIEKSNINDSLKTITKYIELYSDSKINVINYTSEKDNYDKIVVYLRKKYGNIIIENNKTLEDKIRELGLTIEESEIDTLLNYSKDLISNYKNNKIIQETSSLDEYTAKELANNVYDILLDYANRVYNQDINSDKYPIQLIDADEKGEYHPDSHSWYYIKEGKVYAYISFSGEKYKYSFCYKGNNEISNEGQCYEGVN